MAACGINNRTSSHVERGQPSRANTHGATGHACVTNSRTRTASSSGSTFPLCLHFALYYFSTDDQCR